MIDSMASSHRKLSAEFHRLSQICHKDNVAVVSIVRELKGPGHTIIAVFFCIPFLCFLPVPGLSSVFGLIVTIVGVRIALNKEPWLPRRWLKRKIGARTLHKIFSFAEKFTKKVEKFTKPRGHWVEKYAWVTVLNGSLIALTGILLSLPYPPGTNFPPALGVVVLAIGMLEDDALVLTIGYLLFALNVALFTAITLLGVEGLKRLIGLL